jgi:hypothetical protein
VGDHREVDVGGVGFLAGVVPVALRQVISQLVFRPVLQLQPRVLVYRAFSPFQGSAVGSDCALGGVTAVMR